MFITTVSPDGPMKMLHCGDWKDHATSCNASGTYARPNGIIAVLTTNSGEPTAFMPWRHRKGPQDSDQPQNENVQKKAKALPPRCNEQKAECATPGARQLE